MNPIVTLLRRTLAAAALVGLAAGAAPHANAAFITVNSTSDATGNTDGNCTLREAVRAANTDAAVNGCAAGSGADVIVFAPSLNNPTINLDRGQLVITTPIAIEGQNGASSQVAIDALNANRHFSVQNGAAFDASNLILTNGEADLGGSIRYNAGTTGTLTDMTFTINLATVSGGAVFNNGIVLVSGGSFVDNRAQGTTPADGGGAIYNRGTLTVEAGTLFEANKALEGLGNGGAIYNARARSLTIQDNGGVVTFDRNFAARAGGAIESAGSLIMTGADFEANVAGINGGALHMSANATTVINGGTYNVNRADGEGGALWNSASGTLTVNTVVFTTNAADGAEASQGGGAIYSDGGAVMVAGSSFDGNLARGASGSGGAINVQPGSTLEVDSSTFTANEAPRAGGAVEIAGGSGSFSGVDFTDNVTARAPGNGGGLHLGGASTVNIDGGSFVGNQATEGGGVWISGASTAFVINGTPFTNNSARGDASSQGGGGFYSDGGSAFLTDIPFENNSATGIEGSGGGINAQGGNLVVDGGSVTNNTANRAGGGIEVAGGIAVIQNVTVTGNNAGVADDGDDSSAAPGYGGGIHGGGSSNVTVILSDVFSNRAVQGGGLWNGGFSEMNVRRSTVASNNASMSGGGLYQAGGLNGTGKLTINESLVAINNAVTSGGGVGARKAELEIINTSISGNFARNGGGVASVESNVNVLNATIANNSASNRGGGYWTNDGTMSVETEITLSNSIIADNAAPNVADLYGQFVSAGYNLIETTNNNRLRRDVTNVFDQDPLLGPPADNGGPTFTHALLAGSPAIDAGQSSVAVDQRGYGRPVGADDIGAFEFGAVPLVEGPVVADNKNGVTAGETALGLASPNPAATRSSLALSVAETEAVRAVLYDALGRQVATLFDGTVDADAPISLQIDASSLSTGVYIVRVTGQTFARSQQLTVVR